MSKHAIGPWFVNDASTDADPGKLSVEADDGEYFICQVDGGRHQRANAQLIAAAPDLLEALEACYDYGGLTGDSWVVDKVVAAIAKAKGESA